MGDELTQSAWTTLATLLTAGALGTLSDGQLLDHFRSRRDATAQDAFRILVERHGAMVLGVCRSLVKDPHEAEDAFQATFLVLVRRCESIRQRQTIAPWLYGVACRVARRAQARSARRRKREVAADVNLAARDGSNPEDPGTALALQEEIGRLPDSLRAPLVLCCLEGQSYDLAARRLGLRESTLRGRLHRARRRLEHQLRRRGILASAVAGLLEPGRLVLPPLSSSLIESTTQFAVRWATLSGLLVGSAAVPASIAALAQGVIQAMLLQTVKIGGLATVLTIGAVGTLVVAQQERPTRPAGSNGSPPRQARPQLSSEVGATQDKEEIRRLKEEFDRKYKELDARDKSRQILQKLDERFELNLPPDATLDDFLKAIKKATTSGDFPGIPIYVDPAGLHEAHKNVGSPVRRIVGPSRLSDQLREALYPLGLSYRVKDGFMMISSRQDVTEQRLDELDHKIDRLLEAMERLERSKGGSPARGPGS